MSRKHSTAAKERPAAGAARAKSSPVRARRRLPSAALVDRFVANELAVKGAKKALDDAEDERAKTRGKMAAFVAVGETIEAHGTAITRGSQTSGPSFSVAGFLKKHKRLTKAMQPFYKVGTAYDTWRASEIGKPS